jgi:hypothetical protein
VGFVLGGAPLGLSIDHNPSPASLREATSPHGRGEAELDAIPHQKPLKDWRLKCP